jgi:hypothetical protein
VRNNLFYQKKLLFALFRQAQSKNKVFSCGVGNTSGLGTQLFVCR